LQGQDDGKYFLFISTGAYAHTFTATGILNTGAAAVNTATFAAHAGCSLLLMCFNAQWYVVYSNGASFS